MKTYQQELNPIREKINKIDDTLAKLILNRLELAQEVAEIKKRHAIKLKTDKTREGEIIERMQSFSQHPIYRKYVMKIFPLFFRMSKELRQ